MTKARIPHFLDILGMDPTQDQSRFLRAADAFLDSPQPRCTLVLNGYAGTGKTTLLSVLVRYLRAVDRRVVLLAPTGRAAKVMGQYSGATAFTIHKFIYHRIVKAGTYRFSLRENTMTRTVFIVDEASMISGERQYFTGTGNNSLLDDLMAFVFQGTGCRLILVGDQAQLPPVGSLLSPALDADRLNADFQCTIAKISLREVVRQARESLILTNATAIRKRITGETKEFPGLQFADSGVTPVDMYRFQELYEEHLHALGWEEVIVITRSNKMANRYNQQIRSRVFFYEEELSGGDRLMVVRNNYAWLSAEDPTPFIANGDMCEVQRIVRQEEQYGLRFADVELYFPGYDMQLEIKVMLDTLMVEGASLDQARLDKLWENVEETLMDDFPDKKERRKQLKSDPYLNALQVKFAYAVTGHKAQGGQWSVVFVDHGYLTENHLDLEFSRWMYTACTRAREQLYLVNPSPLLVGDVGKQASKTQD